MCSTFVSLFCGFMIKPEDFPSFWIFMYWLDPLHYVLEGVVVTQFNRDDSLVRVTGTPIVTTASNFVESFYSEWRYGHRGYDVLALFLFIIIFRFEAVVCSGAHRYRLNSPCVLISEQSGHLLLLGVPAPRQALSFFSVKKLVKGQELEGRSTERVE